ncbi:MAG: hypothetical protein KAS32_00795 [Candidatus Peribacteraceae bacterium]|nr:hypothetical protein [Candidatus Peribacteraceae bacterium]
MPSLTKAQDVFSKMKFGRLRFAAHSYLNWVHDEKQMLFKTGENEVLLIPCKKRGNEPYRRHIESKLDSLEKQVFSSLGTLYKYRRDEGVGALFVTLTYAESYGLDAWDRVGTDYNLFITKFKKKFGSCHVIRVWEAMKNGRPHIHVLIFLEKRIGAYENKGKIWFNHSPWHILQGLWSHGFAKFDVVRNPAGSYRYLLKYITKAQAVSEMVGIDVILEKWELGAFLTSAENTKLKSVLTTALSWIFRRRQYSFSRGLLNLIQRRKTNSNARDLEFLGIISFIWDPGLFSLDSVQGRQIVSLVPPPPS